MSVDRAIRSILLLAGLLVLPALNSQTPPPDYRFPMSGDEFILSGTFGELRPNHFHSGLDIKTGGEVGRPLVAATSGYVYRIKVSPFGYGNAIYIRNPDGNFNVYGHMSRFSPEIEAIVYQQQYTTKRWEQEIYLSETDLPVYPGKVIGYSGNSGSSQGAHLHFEIRDAEERILNPLQYYRSLVKDDVPPILQTLAFEPLSPDSRINGRHAKLELVPEGKKGVYTVPGVVELKGDIGLEYEGYDLLTGAGNHCGINYSKLFLDGKLIYEFRLEKFSFEEKKFINVHFDYGHHQRSGRKLERCYVAPWNKFEAYRNLVNQGRIRLDDQREHELLLELSDLHGNKTTARARVRGGDHAPIPRTFDYTELTTLDGKITRNMFVGQLSNPSTGHLQGLDALFPGGIVKRVRPAWFEGNSLFFLLDLNQDPLPYALRDPITGKSVEFSLRKRIDPARNMVVEEGEAMAYFPEQAAFEPLPLHFRRLPGTADMYSDVYEIGWREIPLRSPFVLSMRAQRPGRPEHLVIAKKDARGRWVFLGKEVREDGSIYAASSAFGSFCVMADSTPPLIRPANFSAGANISPTQSSLVLEVRDDFSGINGQHILATLDGKWALFEYDAKSNTITHQIRERPSPGVHELEVMAYDMANNLGAMRFTLYF